MEGELLQCVTVALLPYRPGNRSSKLLMFRDFFSLSFLSVGLSHFGLAMVQGVKLILEDASNF